MRYGSYLFQCKFTTPAFLPAFKGSMLRGCFGRALKGITCALRRKHCGDCLLAGNCVYFQIFETGQPVPDNAGKSRIAARPHPYVLAPPLGENRAYGVDDQFAFGVTLFGRTNDFLPYLICTFERLGEDGLRVGTRDGPGRFVLDSIRADGGMVYDGSRKVLHRDQQLPLLTLPPPPRDLVCSLTVRLITPLRLKQHNQFQNSLPFPLLVRAALRRISTLENAYGSGEPDLDYSGLVKRAADISIKMSDCRWIDLSRYSNRQQTAMLIGGLLGNITYEGDLTEFLPLLQFCEKTNLGKQTTFGLGRIAVDLEGK